MQLPASYSLRGATLSRYFKRRESKIANVEALIMEVQKPLRCLKIGSKFRGD